MMGGLIRMMGTIIGVIIWILSVCLTCYLAKRKGRNIALWAVLSVFFSWIVLIIIVCLKPKKVIMKYYASAEGKLKRNGFREKNEEGGDSCAWCNYNWGDGGKACSLYGVKFWDDFKPIDYVCDRCNCSVFDSLIEGIKKQDSQGNN